MQAIAQVPFHFALDLRWRRQSGPRSLAPGCSAAQVSKARRVIDVSATGRTTAARARARRDAAVDVGITINSLPILDRIYVGATTAIRDQWATVLIAANDFDDCARHTGKIDPRAENPETTPR
jgi:hypothetical protein